MNEADEIAFELGYDLARYGHDLPKRAPLILCDGYRAGRRQFPSSAHADRFTAKWLQLRTNAYFRGKRFDEGISPDYLRSLWVPICPVTQQQFTYGTGKDSDWSVDRCNNTLGYVPGNLILMSVRANAAKADLEFAVIEARATANANIDGLSGEEWRRLVNLVAPAERLTSGEAPPQFLSGREYTPGQRVGTAARVQAVLLALLFTYHLENDEFFLRPIDALELILKQEKPSLRAYRRLIKDMARRLPIQNCPWNYWSLKRPSRYFVEWWASLSSRQKAACKSWVERHDPIVAVLNAS